MKFVGLLSGGKDSILAILLAIRAGHECVAVASLYPISEIPSLSDFAASEYDEDIDSFAFQTVGCSVVVCIAECLDVPLFREGIRRGQSIHQSLAYPLGGVEGDEVEVLAVLLQQVKKSMPAVQAVVSGAILSHYQRLRVEVVCHRLSLTSIAPLWQRSARDVLELVALARVDARLIKVASFGLNHSHLGRSLLDSALTALLSRLDEQHGVHAAGEGGEFETLVFDCCGFHAARIEVDEARVVPDKEQPNDVGYLRLRTRVVPKGQREVDEAKETWQRFASAVIPSDRMKFLPPQDSLSQLVALRRADPPDSVEPVNAAEQEDDPRRKREASELAQLCTSLQERRYRASVRAGMPTWFGVVSHPVLVSIPPVSPDESVVDHAARLLRSIRDHLQDTNQEAIFLCLFSPSMQLFSSINREYEKVFDIVNPPGRAFIEDSDLSHLVVVLLCASKSTNVDCNDRMNAPSNVVLVASRSCLHVQSISPWASASIGPYSQANRVRYRSSGIEGGGGRPIRVVNTNSDDWTAATSPLGPENTTPRNGQAVVVEVDHIIVSGRIGMDPATLGLGTRDTLWFSSSSSSSPSDETERRNAAEEAFSEHEKRFLAEFFYMMANSVVALEHFRIPVYDVTHATFFVPNVACVPLLPFAWRAYFLLLGIPSAKIPTLTFLAPPREPLDKSSVSPVHESERRSAETKATCALSPDVVVVAQVVVVTALPKSAVVEVILERRCFVVAEEGNDADE